MEFERLGDFDVAAAGIPRKLQRRRKEWIKLDTCKGIANDEEHLPGYRTDHERGCEYREIWKWLRRFGPLGRRFCLWSKSRLEQLLPGIMALSSPTWRLHSKPGLSHSSSSVSCRRTKDFLPKAWISSFKSRYSRSLSKAASYLLVLVGCDCGKHGLREVECFHSIPNRDRFGGWKVAAEILADHVNSRLVFVHRVQNDLKWEGATWCQSGSKVPIPFQALMQI